MRLTNDQRHLLIDAMSRGVNKSEVARVFGIARSTVYRWWKRYKQYKQSPLQDKPRQQRKRKVTDKVQFTILALRQSFGWGTARIQQGLINLPRFMRVALPVCVQNVRLSRTAINAVLKEHGMNGYARSQKHWKFFRASKTDELWQLDLKGPVHLFGQKYYFLVVVDDYSRYLLTYHCMVHCPTTEDIAYILAHQLRARKPEKILTDNGAQFREQWEAWCKKQGITALFAHAYYPQDKGKVERTIRNLAEEHIKLMLKFPGFMGKEKQYKAWYNTKRFHLGVHALPAELYLASCSVSNCT